MRVTSKAIFDMVKFNLGNITEDLGKANEIVSTGKRITKLSDDPIGFVQSLDIKSSLAGIEQIGRNITFGTSWLNVTEYSLSQAQDLISDAKVLSLQMANDIVSPEERYAAGGTVQNILEEIISLANTEVSGRYIFSGTKTDTKPFSQDGTYSGDNNVFSIKIGKDAAIEVGGDGEAIYGNILNTLSELKNALEADDVAGITDAMSNLDDHFENLSVKISDVGSKMVRMEARESILLDLNIANTERLSKIEDADITEAITQLTSIELCYQAALASSARVMELSLVNYM